MHQRNLQTLATEMCKVNTKISPGVVNSLFEFTNKKYKLRSASSLERKRYFTVCYGSESLLSLAPKIWELVPNSVRVVKMLSIFPKENESLDNR